MKRRILQVLVLLLYASTALKFFLYIFPMTLILGLNAFHADAAAALVLDGKVVAAVEEERFRRIKHWAGFPVDAIKSCLADVGVKLSDVDHVATNTLPKAHFWRKLAYAAINRPEPLFYCRRYAINVSVLVFKSS